MSTYPANSSQYDLRLFYIGRAVEVTRGSPYVFHVQLHLSSAGVTLLSQQMWLEIAATYRITKKLLPCIVTLGEI